MARSLEKWIELYSECHQNPVNKKIHNICVPLIMFSILGILRALPPVVVADFTLHWDWVLVTAGILFYLRLNVRLAVLMLILAGLMVGINVLIAEQTNLMIVSVVIFVLSWMGQFWGHHIEGRKPSFIQDLSFLLIGPLWVVMGLRKNKFAASKS